MGKIKKVINIVITEDALIGESLVITPEDLQYLKEDETVRQLVMALLCREEN